jgi:hypothetical protein
MKKSFITLKAKNKKNMNLKLFLRERTKLHIVLSRMGNSTYQVS